MRIQRSKIIAYLTGFISILICIVYLLLITVFDFRSFLNEKITINQDNFGAIFLKIENFF